MWKELLDYNSPQTAWLRAHPVQIGVIGGVIAAVFLVPTIVAIVKESRS